LDTTRVYLVHAAAVGPSQAVLLLNVTTGQLTHVTDLLTLLTHWSFDSSADGRTLFLGDCEQPENSRVPNTTISSEPATGGASTTLYHQTNLCLDQLRAVLPSTLLFTDEVPGGDFGHKELRRIQTNGTGLVKLADNGGAHTRLLLNQWTQFPWSNLSRNGQLYAVLNQANMSCQQNILIGRLSGGTPQVVVFTCPGLIEVVGWTTL
jgi:hypothetical protein